MPLMTIVELLTLGRSSRIGYLSKKTLWMCVFVLICVI